MGLLSNFIKDFTHNPFKALASLPLSPAAVLTGLYRGLRNQASWNPWDTDASVWDIAFGGTKWSSDPEKRKIGRAIGTAIGSFFTAGALGGALGSSAYGGAASGALWGGAQAAGTGQDPWEGAARGALAGYAAGSMSGGSGGGGGGGMTAGGGSGGLTMGGSGGSGLYGISGGGGSSVYDPFFSTGGAAGTAGAGIYAANAPSGGGNYSVGAPLVFGTGFETPQSSAFGGFDSTGLAGGTGLNVTPGGVRNFGAGPSGMGGALSPFDSMQDYLRRMWRDPQGRMMLIRGAGGLYANMRHRKLERELRDVDITKQPGYATGEKSVRRRMAAQGYGNSTNMLKELQDYGAREYDRYAANRRADYQAKVGALMNDLNTLGMLSLAFGGR